MLTMHNGFRSPEIGVKLLWKEGHFRVPLPKSFQTICGDVVCDSQCTPVISPLSLYRKMARYWPELSRSNRCVVR